MSIKSIGFISYVVRFGTIISFENFVCFYTVRILTISNYIIMTDNLSQFSFPAMKKLIEIN